MRLEKYIAQLLYRYHCVTVPEFGSFLTETRSAKLQPSTSTFYPPKKILSFNALLKKNDGLLIHHISQQTKIPYNDAVKFVQQEVSLWKNTLDTQRVIELKSIGEIYLNSENNLYFSAADNTNYLTESFGLAPIVSPIIRRNYTQEVNHHQEVTEKENNEPIIVSLDSRPKKLYPFIKYVAAAIIVFSLGIFVNNYYGNHIEQQTLLVEKSVQEEIHNRIQEATFVIENPAPAITLTVKKEKLNYHIVAGAFREETNAEQEYLNLSNQGYKARKLEKNKYGLYPVLYQSYATYEEARESIKQIRTSNPDAWLLIQEL